MWLLVKLFLLLLVPSISYACVNGEFRSAAGGCFPILRCDQLSALELGEQLEGGAVKSLWKAVVVDTEVVYAIPTSDSVKEDFLHGMRMLKALQSEHVVQLVGYCDDKFLPQMATRYYEYGSARRLNNIFEAVNLTEHQEFGQRLQIALDYIRIIAFLHASPIGTRVMCDANDLEKTLSQFLISEDMRLVVADLDALPIVDHSNGLYIKCGHRQLGGAFVAPEQYWPYDSEEFSDNKMPGYDEKIDIWRIPDMVEFFLGDSVFAEEIKARMFDLFLKCKYIDPKKRPTAVDVLVMFKNTLKLLDYKQEL